MKLTFICLGAQKAGTDWVYDQFASHDDYEMPSLKEIAFFDKGFGGKRTRKAEKRIKWMTIKHEQGKADYSKDIQFLKVMLESKPDMNHLDFNIYRDLLAYTDKHVADVTPGYCRIQEPMAKRMLEEFPDTKFFLKVRDPASRLWSQAQMHVRLERSLGASVTNSIEELKEFAQHKHVQKLSFLSRSIETWKNLADEDRYQVFCFDDLKKDADEYRTRIANFVGADPTKFNLPANFNKKAKQPGKKKIPEHYRAWLAEWFKDEFDRLADLMGGDAILWKEKNDAILSA